MHCCKVVNPVQLSCHSNREKVKLLILSLEKTELCSVKAKMFFGKERERWQQLESWKPGEFCLAANQMAAIKIHVNWRINSLPVVIEKGSGNSDTSLHLTFSHTESSSSWAACSFVIFFCLPISMLIFVYLPYPATIALNSASLRA